MEKQIWSPVVVRIPRPSSAFEIVALGNVVIKDPMESRTWFGV
jgi:hypothetical protein